MHWIDFYPVDSAIQRLNDQELVFSRIKGSLQWRRILGGPNLVHVCIVVATIFDFDRGRLGRVEIVTLGVGARAKEGKGEGGGEKKNTPFSLLSPRPLPAPFDSPYFLISSGVSIWRFHDQIKTFARPKKTPELQVR